MDTCEAWGSVGLGVGSFIVSYIYINNLSLTINKLASPILFADDTTIIISNANPEEFQNNII